MLKIASTILILISLALIVNKSADAQAVFRDFRFEDFRDGVADDWLPDSQRWSIVDDDRYRFFGTKSGSAGKTTFQINFTNFTFKINVKRLRGVSGSMSGFIFMEDKDKGFPGYAFDMKLLEQPEPLYRLRKFLPDNNSDGIPEELILKEWTPTPMLRGINEWNTVRLTSDNGLFKIFANSLLVDTFNDSDYHGGKVSLIVADPVDSDLEIIDFDDINIQLEAFTSFEHHTTGLELSSFNEQDSCANKAKKKDTFINLDKSVSAWARFENGVNGAILIWEWLSPDGAVFLSTVQDIDTDALFCSLAQMEIFGTPAALMPGEWKVRAVVDGRIIFTDSFRIKEIPIAKFTADPIAGLPPLDVQFTDLSTGDIEKWDWDFGDNGKSAKQHPLHTYKKSGNFSVRLKVSIAEAESEIIAGNLIRVLGDDPFPPPKPSDTPEPTTSPGEPAPSETPEPTVTPEPEPKPDKISFTFTCDKKIKKGPFGIKKLTLRTGEQATCIAIMTGLAPGESIEMVAKLRQGVGKAIKVEPESNNTNENAEAMFIITAERKGSDWAAWAIPNEDGEIKFNREAYKQGLAWGMVVDVKARNK